MQAFAPGIYPRSEQLVQATRDLDRGRTTPEAVDAQFERDLEELVRVQQAAGLDLLADGMLRWQDLFRPLVEAAAGLEPGPLTRFLDTNSFNRAPARTAQPVRLERPLDEHHIAHLPAPRLVTLPSPFAFARSLDVSPRELADTVLAPQLAALPESTELVVLSEPFLTQTDDPDLDGLADALETLAGGPAVALQLTFGDAGQLLPRLAELPVAALGVDFFATALEAVPEGLAKLLLAGVVDGRSSVLEDPRELAAFALRLRERGVERIALVPNGDLQYVSEPIAREKLARLGRAKTAPAEEAA